MTRISNNVLVGALCVLSFVATVSALEIEEHVQFIPFEASPQAYSFSFPEVPHGTFLVTVQIDNAFLGEVEITCTNVNGCPAGGASMAASGMMTTVELPVFGDFMLCTVEDYTLFSPALGPGASHMVSAITDCTTQDGIGNGIVYSTPEEIDAWNTSRIVDVSTDGDVQCVLSWGGMRCSAPLHNWAGAVTVKYWYDPPFCGNSADVNGDGTVNVQDLTVVLGRWKDETCAPPIDCPEDTNCDGAVNTVDLVAVILAWD